jgi:hypothetical protein
MITMPDAAKGEVCTQSNTKSNSLLSINDNINSTITVSNSIVTQKPTIMPGSTWTHNKTTTASENEASAMEDCDDEDDEYNVGIVAFDERDKINDRSKRDESAFEKIRE